ncbi:putative phage tail protein [Brevibacillus sp. SAFN-007a]|uniref:putative phage tail protein n=1 Tax=Brevibacillus sp. SAFN-007a TaxID=3436862 RepID=UPI003F801F53
MSRADEMLKRLQPFQRKSKLYQAIFDAELPQYVSREEAITDLRAQMDVSTATWALVIYEYEYGIKTDPSKTLEARRSSVIAKMRGAGKFTAPLAHAIVSAFTDRVSRVTFTGRIKIQFDELTDLDLAVVAAALEDVKPAHIDVEYDLKNNSALVISDKVIVHHRRYHKVSEFRVGMKPLRYQSEVTL